MVSLVISKHVTLIDLNSCHTAKTFLNLAIINEQAGSKREITSVTKDTLVPLQTHW